MPPKVVSNLSGGIPNRRDHPYRQEFPCANEALIPNRFKAQFVQECLQTGAFVPSVAISHGINANVIRKWIAL
ncbi:transposase [Pseudomonas syringae]|uniref:transposase n=1 Tax=Pseudomonas syringae TaxID=317 RepID=UPI0003FC391B